MGYGPQALVIEFYIINSVSSLHDTEHLFAFAFISFPHIPSSSVHSAARGSAQALERQKEYTDAIRTERDELREEVVKLKDILKVKPVIIDNY